MSRFDLHKSYLSRWLLHPVGEYSYAFPTPHVCSPRELIHCLDKTHDPSKCARCLHWNWSILWLWWQLDIPAAYKPRRRQPSPSRCYTQFPTLPGLSPPLSQNTWLYQPPASAPCLSPLEQQVKVAIGQDPKASKMIIPQITYLFFKSSFEKQFWTYVWYNRRLSFHRNSKSNSSATGFKGSHDTETVNLGNSILYGVFILWLRFFITSMYINLWIVYYKNITKFYRGKLYKFLQNPKISGKKASSENERLIIGNSVPISHTYAKGHEFFFN